VFCLQCASSAGSVLLQSPTLRAFNQLEAIVARLEAQLGREDDPGLLSHDRDEFKLGRPKRFHGIRRWMGR